ncbi:phosphatase PAP2 family protein [Marinilabiliaceae bacterium JC017]|nr:phosphatase PAP2 family protein [Marinilabiliaceae bacterium JC017]
MSLLNTLLEFDKDLLLYLNSFHSPLWDNFFWIFTSTTIWIPFYAAVTYVIFRNHGIRGFVALVAIGVLILLCDQISTNIFKDGFERFRPSHNPEIKNIIHLINGKRGGNYGFVSSHATNSFGLAMFTALIFRRGWYTFFIFAWAALNSYSRIYMGLHFPGDITGGLLLGLLLGKVVYEIYLRVLPRFMVISHHNKRTYISGLANSFNKQSPNILVFTLIIMFATIFLSAQLTLKLM